MATYQFTTYQYAIRLHDDVSCVRIGVEEAVEEDLVSMEVGNDLGQLRPVPVISNQQSAISTSHK